MILKHEHFDLKNKIILQRVVFQPPLKIDGSMHDEACFLHIRKGNSRLYTPNNQYDIQSKDNLVMKCGSYLNNWLVNEDNSPNEAIAIHFYPEVLQLVFEDQLPQLFLSDAPNTTAVLEKVTMDTMITNYIDSLLFYFDNPSLVTDELIKLKTKEIILLLINGNQAEQIRAILRNAFEPQQYEFKEIIQAHLFENLSLQDLAVLTGCSLSSFKRKFNTVFGTSPTRYIKAKRLEKAKQLLDRTSLTISEIAYDCGFNDVGYFSKSFTAQYQSSPSAYRKTLLD